MRGLQVVRALGLASLVSVAGPGPVANAQEQYWSYKDWNVMAETVDTGEDLRVTCTIWTGGDGWPTLRSQISNGDAGPPDFYPPITVDEHAIRHFATQMQAGNPVVFSFDDGSRMEAEVQAGFDDEGFAIATAAIPGRETLAVLKAMRANSSIDIGQNGKTILKASLSGFTAAYGKMAEACNFSTVGVID